MSSTFFFGKGVEGNDRVTGEAVITHDNKTPIT